MKSTGRRAARRAATSLRSSRSGTTGSGDIPVWATAPQSSTRNNWRRSNYTEGEQPKPGVHQIGAGPLRQLGTGHVWLGAHRQQAQGLLGFGFQLHPDRGENRQPERRRKVGVTRINLRGGRQLCRREKSGHAPSRLTGSDRSRSPGYGRSRRARSRNREYARQSFAAESGGDDETQASGPMAQDWVRTNNSLGSGRVTPQGLGCPYN